MRIRNVSFLTEWLLLCGGLFLLGSYIAFSLYTQRQEIDAHEWGRLSTQARVVHDNLARQLNAINRALLNVRTHLPRWQTDKDGMVLASGRLQAFVDAMPIVGAMLILDSEGNAIAASHDRLRGSNFARQACFQAAQNSPAPDTLYVSPPFKVAADAWAMNVARAIVGPNGEFKGIVSASLAPEELKIMLESVRYAPDMWAALAHGDGLQFLMAPDRAGQAGKNLQQPGSFFTRHIESKRSANVLTGTVHATSEHRMTALHTVQPDNLRMDKPLVVAIGRDMDTLLREWHDQARMLGALFSLIVVICLSGLHLLQRRRRAALSAERTEIALLEKSAEVEHFFDVSLDLLCIADFAGRFVKLNPAWTQVLGYDVDELTGQQINGFIHSDDRAAMLDATARLAAGEAVASLVTRFRGKNGEYRHLEWRSVPYPESRLVYAGARDVSEQRGAQEALEDLNAKLQAKTEQLRSLAFIDGLTGVANRRRFDEALQAEWRRCRRDNSPLALLMVDIDHFKRYNDRHGHQSGDDCLKVVATAMKSRLNRSHDLVGRYGGEEFVCLLPDSDLAGACAKAEELRIAVESLNIPHESSPTARMVTISIGIAAHTPDGDAHPEQLLSEADTALYEAKHSGRNRACTTSLS